MDKNKRDKVERVNLHDDSVCNMSTNMVERILFVDVSSYLCISSTANATAGL